jgi:hypothetical protein
MLGCFCCCWLVLGLQAALPDLRNCPAQPGFWGSFFLVQSSLSGPILHWEKTGPSKPFLESPVCLKSAFLKSRCECMWIQAAIRRGATDSRLAAEPVQQNHLLLFFPQQFNKLAVS